MCHVAHSYLPRQRSAPPPVVQGGTTRSVAIFCAPPPGAPATSIDMRRNLSQSCCHRPTTTLLFAGHGNARGLTRCRRNGGAVGRHGDCFHGDHFPLNSWVRLPGPRFSRLSLPL